MIIKVISGILIVGSATLIGAKLADKKRFRKSLYFELVEFCHKIKSDIGFNNTTTDKLLSSLCDNTLHVLGICGKDYAVGQNISIEDKRLTIDEKEKIADFFNGLGSYGEEGTVNMISHYRDYFSKKYAECDEIYKKTGAFYIKMGALVGALVYLIVV